MEQSHYKDEYIAKRLREKLYFCQKSDVKQKL